MKGIVIAAGLGSRMGHLTDEMPKCMLPINGQPLLHHTMDRMREAGCNELVVIVGYKAQHVDALDAAIVENKEFASNNILHSLMSAEKHLHGPVMCSYSDIWVEPGIHQELTESQKDIVIAVDEDWLPYYDGRTQHPVDEAENVFFDDSMSIRQIGKHLRPENAGTLRCGEFLGLWWMSDTGTRNFREHFKSLDKNLDREEPFQRAKHWRTAYITDMLQELSDRGIEIDCAVTQRGWAELDTVEDYNRLASVAKRQRLHSICAPQRND